MPTGSYTARIFARGDTMDEIIGTAFTEAREAAGPDAALNIATFPDLSPGTPASGKKYWSNVEVTIAPAPAAPRQVTVDAGTLKAGLDWAMNHFAADGDGWSSYNKLRIALGDG